MAVSRSAVALHERGDRRLPQRTEALLEPLYAVLPPPEATDQPLPAPVLTAADRAELTLLRQALALQIYPLEQELARCRVRLAQAQLWVQALPALRATFSAANNSAQLWLNDFNSKAAAIRQEEAAQPALLKLRLATLAFEMAEIDRLLGEAAPA